MFISINYNKSKLILENLLNILGKKILFSLSGTMNWNQLDPKLHGNIFECLIAFTSSKFSLILQLRIDRQSQEVGRKSF